MVVAPGAAGRARARALTGAKPSKRDVARSRASLLEVDEAHRLESGGDFPYPEDLWLDVTDLPPADAAARIARHFDLR